MDKTFLTRAERKPTTFELKYLEKIGESKEKRNALAAISPEVQEKERETEEVDQELAETRTKFENWRNQFQVKKKELEAQNNLFLEKKQAFDKAALIQQNEIENCKEREKQARDAIAQYNDELAQITLEEKKLQEENQALIKEIKELQPYCDYLQQVVERSHSYDNPEAILYRQKNLLNGRKEYLEKYRKLIAQKGLREKELNEELVKQKARLVGSTMKFNSIIAQVNKTKKQNQFVKTALIKDVQRLEEKSLEVSTIKSAIKTIYERAIEMSTRQSDKLRSGVEKEEDMLLYITDRFNDLTKIIDKWNLEPHPAN